MISAKADIETYGFPLCYETSIRLSTEIAFAGGNGIPLPSVRLPPATSFKRIRSELLPSANQSYPPLTSPWLLSDDLWATAELPVLPTLRLAEASQLQTQEPCRSGLYVGRHAQIIAVPSSIVANLIVMGMDATKSCVSNA